MVGAQQEPVCPPPPLLPPLWPQLPCLLCIGQSLAWKNQTIDWVRIARLFTEFALLNLFLHQAFEQVCERSPSGTSQPVVPPSGLVLLRPLRLVLWLWQLCRQPSALQCEEPRSQGQVQRGRDAEAWLWWWIRWCWRLDLWARLGDCTIDVRKIQLKTSACEHFHPSDNVDFSY